MDEQLWVDILANLLVNYEIVHEIRPKFLNWTVMSKAEMLKEIKNRLEFIDKIIIFENQEKNNNDKVEKEFFNLLFKENIQEIRNFLTQHPIHLNHLTIIEKTKII